MLTGRFGATTTAPYLEGMLELPRFGVRGPVSFLIDTGADTTTLSPEVIQRLAVDYGLFTEVQTASGIGGTEDLFAEAARVFFLDPDRNEIIGYDIQVSILPLSPQYLGYPSLLGRDVVNRWRLECDFANGIVAAEVRSADPRVPL